ncbi:acyl-homoserine-lactone synthase [Bradyrhizobium sp. CB2312]|uniref:acyl-homoserine-lactone synthase n=1 Tax=Bradyrhizobium sp. CB2312 TaxID=3039155 RepID=UPI0024B10635|nr:acyl-homoserine-lactone synthase [Bradyrhizobium sp. CB2312]WFU75443.1 acyl-homoserine-lactone synthase [Bradyrhizobium sp. CB2312]
MIRLITGSSYAQFSKTLKSMHRLRFRVFKERLNWAVETDAGLEVDSFDALQPAYLAQLTDEGEVQGSVRLLPTLGPTMLRDKFPMLLGDATAPQHPQLWESSRFAIETRPDAPKGKHKIARATYELFAGMIEFGLSRGLTDIVTVTDVRMERILRRAGWPLRRIGVPHLIGNTTAVAGYLGISHEVLIAIRSAGELNEPSLWAPVLQDHR